MTKSTLAALAISFFLIACNGDARKAELDAREASLKDKERLLLSKEAEYQSLVRMRDSINQLRDTVVALAWPENIRGQWSSKIVCVESNCSDYVIGDTRNDTWQFTQDSTQLLVKVFDRNNLIRVFNARYQNDQITLNYATDSTAQKKVAMEVNLNEILPNRIRGNRTVNINNDCSAKFTVSLVRSSTN